MRSICWIEPSAFLTSAIILSSHRPRAFSSATRYRFTCMNSPERVSRLNRFDTWGSMHS